MGSENGTQKKKRRKVSSKADWHYLPWVRSWIWQRPTIGDKWYRGNFTFGLLIDSHPRFVHVIIGVWFVEFGVAWSRDRVMR